MLSQRKGQNTKTYKVHIKIKMDTEKYNSMLVLFILFYLKFEEIVATVGLHSNFFSLFIII